MNSEKGDIVAVFVGFHYFFLKLTITMNSGYDLYLDFGRFHN